MNANVSNAALSPAYDGVVAAGMAKVVDSLGTSKFPVELVRCLHSVAGAEHCVIYCLRPKGIDIISAASLDGSDDASSRAMAYVNEGLWKTDQGFAQAYSEGRARRSGSMRVEKKRPARDTLQILEKVFLFGARRNLYGISVLKNRCNTHFSDAALRCLDALAEFVVSCCDKHVDHRGRVVETVGTKLESIAHIEERVRLWGRNLTNREQQVCSRILYGLTMEGIAIDLGIKPESVITYKKRAFLKYGIGTRHELMRHYLQFRGMSGDRTCGPAMRPAYR